MRRQSETGTNSMPKLSFHHRDKIVQASLWFIFRSRKQLFAAEFDRTWSHSATKSTVSLVTSSVYVEINAAAFLSAYSLDIHPHAYPSLMLFSFSA